MIKIGNTTSSISVYTFQPKNKDELREIIHKRIDDEGFNCDLNDIDTFLIEDMSFLFEFMDFNGDISRWNTSNVTNMESMFEYTKFNNDISRWNVSNVKDMYGMFYNSLFDKDISNWKINKNCDTRYMFRNCPIKEEHKPKKTQDNDQDRKLSVKHIDLYMSAKEQE